MPKVTKILRICLTLKTVVNFEPVSYISSPTDVEGKVKKRSGAGARSMAVPKEQQKRKGKERQGLFLFSILFLNFKT